MGERLKNRGITLDRLLSSRWCRCHETARLLDLGPVEAFPPLDSFHADADQSGEGVAAGLPGPGDRYGHPSGQHHRPDGCFPRSAEVIIVRLGARPSDPLTLIDRIGPG